MKGSCIIAKNLNHTNNAWIIIHCIINTWDMHVNLHLWNPGIIVPFPEPHWEGIIVCLCQCRKSGGLHVTSAV